MKKIPHFFIALLLFLVSSSSFSQNFTISNGASIVTNGAVTIDYGGGTLTNNGILNITGGTLLFSGAVTVASANTTNTKNFTVAHPSGTTVLNNIITVAGALKVSSRTLNASNNLILASNPAGSAVIAPVGNITIKNYNHETA